MRSGGVFALSRQVHLSLQRHSTDAHPSKAQLTALLAETSLDGCEPLLRRLPSSLFDGARGASGDAPVSLGAFVDEVAALASENPLLCRMSRRVRRETAAADLDSEVYRYIKRFSLGRVTPLPMLLQTGARKAVFTRPLAGEAAALCFCSSY